MVDKKNAITDHTFVYATGGVLASDTQTRMTSAKQPTESTEFTEPTLKIEPMEATEPKDSTDATDVLANTDTNDKKLRTDSTQTVDRMLSKEYMEDSERYEVAHSRA